MRHVRHRLMKLGEGQRILTLGGDTGAFFFRDASSLA
jgi:hypothetical protein